MLLWINGYAVYMDRLFKLLCQQSIIPKRKICSTAGWFERPLFIQLLRVSKTPIHAPCMRVVCSLSATNQMA